MLDNFEVVIKGWSNIGKMFGKTGLSIFPVKKNFSAAVVEID